MGRKHVSEFDKAARRRINPWIVELLDDMTGSDVLRAIHFWKVTRGQRPKSFTCGWCKDLANGKLCKACQMREDARWKARVRASGRVPIPPIENIAERLQRIEDAIFEPNGVTRVEDGPFSPEAVKELVALSEGRTSDVAAS